MTLTTDAVQQAPAPAREAVYRPGHPLDLMATVGMLQRGRNDPTMVVEGGRVWMAFRTDAGIATLCLRVVADVVHATAWGPGAGEALDQVPRLCGADDDFDGFDVSGHPALSEVARRRPGIRLTRTGRVFDALACAIIEQKVTGMQAFGAWRHLVSRHGERAPGPRRGRCSPPPLPTYGGRSPPGRSIAPGWSRRSRAPSPLRRCAVPPSSVPCWRHPAATRTKGSSPACPASVRGRRLRRASAHSETRMRSAWATSTWRTKSATR